MSDRDPLEAAFLAGTISALRRRAEALRQRAQPGVTALDGYQPIVIVVASESATAIKIAKDFERIADELASEAP